jgi:glycosyltransferase involved in cell wall biosynthesis
MSAVKWHILTGEYPPRCGGVGDYTALLASALRDAGDVVDVWVPGSTLPDTFGAGTERALQQAWRQDPGIVLLQYVPNALGSGGANLRFCRWLLARRREGVDVRSMFHEPYMYFSVKRPWRNVAAAVQRVMARTLMEASTRVYYSSATWDRYLRPYGAPAGAITLPIPATVPAAADENEVPQFRAAFAPSGGPVVGHFGTFGEHVTTELLPILLALHQQAPAVSVALIGDRGDEFQRRLRGQRPNMPRTFATGRLPLERVAAAIRACDVLVQPYPDGVTTRRTTIMAGLISGVATVTSEGPLTEGVWYDTHAACLAPSGNATATAGQVCRLLADAAERRDQARRGRDTYGRSFAIERTVAVLRGSGAAAVAR